MDTRTISDASDFSIATAPPTAGQRQASLIVATIVLAATGAMTAFGATQLQQIDGFIPATEFVIFVSDFFTAALLSSHAGIIGSHRLLVLASGYLFSALMVVSHALTFPGAFAPSGLLGGGVQTTPWLFIFWHLGFPASVIVYACLKDERRTLPPSTIYWSVALVVILALLLTWFATVHDDILPPLFDDRRTISSLGNHVTGIDFLTSLVALALLWRRQKSVLDLWLTVAVVALVAELWVTTFVIGTRFSLGFYVSRLLSVTVSVVVLIALLTESTALYARLSNAIALLQRERANRLMSVDAATAAIAHEINQPLGAISINCMSALRWLNRADLEEVRACLTATIDDTKRANDIVASIRGLFKPIAHHKTLVEVNSVVQQVLNMVENDLRVYRVSVSTEFQDDLSQIMADRVQMQEVILNLVKNAIEAMVAGRTAIKTLRLVTTQDRNSVLKLSVQDTGPGLNPENATHVFDPFFTTKPSGMGLGLSISQRIIEDFGGELRLTKAGSNGCTFEITLPGVAPGDGGELRQC
ncbi:MAG: MASE4 domain-containing protein [Xanthobacteraceae bacterium]|jgi:signal transduction histidine kinase